MEGRSVMSMDWKKGRRPLAGLAVMLLLFVAGGASCPGVLHQYVEPIPPVLTEEATLPEIIEAVNANTARVRALSTDNASIKSDGLPALKSRIVFEGQNYFRLQARLLGSEEVDLGSNRERFWLWIKRSTPKALYFCRHDQFDQSPARRMFPVEPRWLVGAIGLPHFDPQDQHHGPYRRDGGRIEVHTVHATSLGNQTKVTVIDDRRGWVLEQRLYDAKNRLIASATAQGHRSHTLGGDIHQRVVLPQIVHVQWPAMGLSMKIDLGEVTLNGAPVSDQVWAMPDYSGWKNIDLGSQQLPATLKAIPSRATVPPAEYGRRPAEYGRPPADHNSRRRVAP
jgi:hypothetical protein